MILALNERGERMDRAELRCGDDRVIFSGGRVQCSCGPRACEAILRNGDLEWRCFSVRADFYCAIVRVKHTDEMMFATEASDDLAEASKTAGARLAFFLERERVVIPDAMRDAVSRLARG